MFCVCAGEVGEWSKSMCDSYVQLYTMTDFSVLSCNNYHVNVSHKVCMCWRGGVKVCVIVMCN